MPPRDQVTGEELQVLVQYQLVAALQEREHDLAEAQRIAHLGSWSWDVTSGDIAWSDELFRVLGVARDFDPDLDAFLALVHATDRRVVREVICTAVRAQQPFTIEHRLVTGGPSRWVRTRGQVDDTVGGRVVRMHGTVQDVTEAVVAQRRLVALEGAYATERPARRRTTRTRLTGRDMLTGLADHAALIDHATDVLGRARREGWNSAVCIVDIDRFRNINEAFGHGVGDDVLVAIGARLMEAFQNPARFGADRFVIVCENVADDAAGSRIADRAARLFDQPITVSGVGEISLTAGVGLSIGGPSGPGLDQLILDAEAALRTVKLRGRGRSAVVTASASNGSGHRLEMEQALGQAMARGELCLHYQPKVSFETGRVSGAEALLRWDSPGRGLIPPSEFIGLAEETGLIIPIGAWVLGEACRQATEYQRHHPRTPPLVIAVNVSGSQFGPELVDVVRSALAGHGTDPAQLCLEVTESVMMDDPASAVDTLGQLAALGVRLSIDDFGTGYSSLSYLKRFPIHEVKVDQCFVAGLGVDPSDTAIVAATVAMAHALGLSVTAEGVETEDQYQRLRAIGCQEGQGYFLARPQPAERLADMIDSSDALGWEPGGRGHTARYRPETVVVVDDDPDLCELARMALVSVGFEVHTATDGATGLSTALATLPDCVVLDVALPAMPGLDVCRGLRADPALASCAIVMLSGDARSDVRLESFASGADDYIVKPFSPRDLVLRVRAAMRSRTEVAV